MFWFILAFLTALSDSLKDLFSKKNLLRMDVYVVAWSHRFFALLFLLPFFLFVPIPKLTPLFWQALLISGSLNIVASILYMKAMYNSDISITKPMIAFSPVFLLFTSAFILGEFPNIIGLLGVFLIVIGSYVLNVQERHKGLKEPIRALFREKGPKQMLAVAVLWSFTANFDKIGILNSSPLFWSLSAITFLTITLFPIMLYKSRQHLRQIPENLKTLIPLGFFGMGILVTQMTALTLTLVVYVSAVKRFSIVLTAIWGKIFFHESNFKERLAGIILMFLGVLIILFV